MTLASSAEVVEEDKVDKADDDLRPPKKTKCTTDETCVPPFTGG